MQYQITGLKNKKDYVSAIKAARNIWSYDLKEAMDFVKGIRDEGKQPFVDIETEKDHRLLAEYFTLKQEKKAAEYSRTKLAEDLAIKAIKAGDYSFAVSIINLIR
jgi:hypothetical protein